MQDEYAMIQKTFYGFEVRMTNNNFDEVGSKFSQNRHTLIIIEPLLLGQRIFYRPQVNFLSVKLNTDLKFWSVNLQNGPLLGGLQTAI